MDIRNLLFPSFPRLFGNPKSYLIYSFDDLNRLSSINSGINDDCFCSICHYDENKNPIFSDIFFEVDSITPEPVRKVALWFEERKIPYVCLSSGNRGIHIHGLFKPEIVNQKTLKNFSNMILDQTETKDFFDSHVSGVLEKLCRIPNTQRLGNGWCVPITREELFFLNNPEDFKRLCISPRFLDFPYQERKSIFEFIEEDTTEEKPVPIIEGKRKDIFFLKSILRPCVYKAILTPNPKHIFRIDATVELLNHGLTVDQILNSYEKIQWIDFDRSFSRYQIEFIDEKRKSGELRVFGKQKLGCEKKMSCLKCILES